MKIRHKLSGVFLAFTLAITFLFYFSELRSQKIAFRQIASERLGAVERSFFNFEKNDARMLLSTLEAVRRDPGLKTAYLSGDRDRLYSAARPLFNDLKASFGITNLSFHLPDGRIFLRMNDRSLYGDRLKMAALERASQSLLPSWDFGPGKTAFALRAAVPYFGNGKLIGYVVLTEGINHLLDYLKKEEPDSELAIFADKKYLDRADWRYLRQRSGLKDNWNDLKDHVALAATGGGKAAPACFTEGDIGRAERNEYFFRQAGENGRNFMCGGFGIRDNEGRPIGAVMTLIDISGHVARINALNRARLLMSVLLFLATFSAAVVISRFIVTPLTELEEAAKAVGRGDLDRKVGVSSSDEIGDLAGAFNEMARMRKKAEDELRSYKDELELLVDERTRELGESEARYRTIIETAQEGIWMMDAEARITFVNEKMAQMLGYEKEQILGRHLTDFLEPGSHPEFNAVYERRQQGIAEKFDYKLRTSDGSEIWVIVSSSPRFSVSGEFLGWVSMIMDITERKRLEAVAEAANLMENTGYIFSGIRHEIANPVSTAMITLGVLKRKTGDLQPEQINEYIDRALEQMSRLDFLIRSMRNFNLFETVNPANVELSAYLERFIALVRGDAMKKNIQMEYAPLSEPLFACIDERAFHQVLLNIFTNAVDALEGVPAPKIKISTAKIKKMAMVRVEDNGRGMTEKRVRGLFKPFSTTKPHGTGLGLMIVKKMLSKMQGYIEITSEPGAGTMVDIFVPEGVPENAPDTEDRTG